MKSFFLIFPILCFINISCKEPTQSGKYLTFDMKSHDPRFTSRNYLSENDSISQFLQQRLRGKKYFLTYQKEFVILKDLQENEETVLAKRTGYDYNPNGVYYSSSITKNAQTFQVGLYPDTSNTNNQILLIDLEVPDGTEQSIRGYITPGKQYGRVVCYLSKLEE